MATGTQVWALNRGLADRPSAARETNIVWILFIPLLIPVFIFNYPMSSLLTREARKNGFGFCYGSAV
jgi:hypothetical protein